jgi:hypothetical protein
MAIGRISGPLLKANLIRDGVDLAFETDLLYLDVTNSRIGVNTSAPSTDLDINGTTRSTNLILENGLDVGNIHINNNTIASDLPVIRFEASPGEAVVYNNVLQVDEIQITGNTISTYVSNSNLEFIPNGTGIVDIIGNTTITGNLQVDGNISATGNIVIGGNITIGDADTDTIDFVARIASNVIPELDDTHTLGSSSFRWRSVYADNVYANTLNVPTLNIGNLQLYDNVIATTAGQDLYIDGNSTGGVRLGNFRIVDNVITNVSSNAITQIAQSGTGYFKIQGTNGFVPPRGTSAEQPTAYAVIGMTRYNTTSKALEVWDGIAWASPAGASGAVSEIQANDISAAFAIALG